MWIHCCGCKAGSPHTVRRTGSMFTGSKSRRWTIRAGASKLTSGKLPRSRNPLQRSIKLSKTAPFGCTVRLCTGALWALASQTTESPSWRYSRLGRRPDQYLRTGPPARNQTKGNTLPFSGGVRYEDRSWYFEHRPGGGPGGRRNPHPGPPRPAPEAGSVGLTAREEPG